MNLNFITLSNSRVGEKISSRIEGLGWTVDDFATNVLGVNKTTLNDWLSGKLKIEIHLFELMLLSLRLGPRDLFENNLPPVYQDAASFNTMLKTLISASSESDADTVINKYSSLFRMGIQHLSFHRIPVHNDYLVIQSDGNSGNHWVLVELNLQSKDNSSPYIFSHSLGHDIRMMFGSLTSTKFTITARTYFTDTEHTVKRRNLDTCLCAFWVSPNIKTYLIEHPGGVSGRVIDYAEDIAKVSYANDVLQFKRMDFPSINS